MNQAELSHLVSRMRIKPIPSHLKLRSPLGPRGGLEKMRKTVSALIVNERMEINKNRGLLVRQYAERLISDAVTFGPRHKHTSEMAAWWLEDDKSAVHKLFKVLVPRFQEHTTSYTRLFNAPVDYDPYNYNPGANKDLVLIELKGHPFPPLEYSNTRPNGRHLHNVLLNEARREFRVKRSAGAAAGGGDMSAAKEEEPRTIEPAMAAEEAEKEKKEKKDEED